MALKFHNFVKKGGYLNLLQTTISRQNHTAVIFRGIQNSDNNNNNNNNNNKKGGERKCLHASAAKSYPSAPAIPLPHNMIQIFGNETGRFTPERTRDITGPMLIYQINTTNRFDKTNSGGFNFTEFIPEPNRSNLYTDSYDCNGSVSLNSSMQSNVPQPFSSEGKSTHLNMPGGQWARNDKYIADDMQKSHYAKIKPDFNKPLNGKGVGGNMIARNLLSQTLHHPTQNHISRYSTGTSTSSSSSSSSSSTTPNESGKSSTESSSNANDSAVTKLKRAFKDYGSTVIVFHVGISLASLGTCYVAISSGVDVQSLVNSLGFVDNEKIQSILSNSSTFLIAFAVHKLFAPVRISITLATTPFLVRYLRKAGILKVK